MKAVVRLRERGFALLAVLWCLGIMMVSVLGVIVFVGLLLD
jgi:ABC-type Fe3+-siderophore transport system permease subunit